MEKTLTRRNPLRTHLLRKTFDLDGRASARHFGVTPKCRRRDAAGFLTAALDGPKTIEIAVSDSGQGVPAEQLTHIFEPFFTTKPNGMGMGLPISRTITTAHNGRLWAENRNEGGASFRLTLPIAEDVTK